MTTQPQLIRVHRVQRSIKVERSMSGAEPRRNVVIMGIKPVMNYVVA
jgi:hypothetical protein